MEGSVSQLIVSFVSLLFEALMHEEPMICYSEPIGNVLLAGPTMVLFHLAAMEQLLTSMFTSDELFSRRSSLELSFAKRE
eukprot:99960-Pleurochrysis_carterae.AAC.1